MMAWFGIRGSSLVAVQHSHQGTRYTHQWPRADTEAAKADFARRRWLEWATRLFQCQVAIPGGNVVFPHAR